MKKEDSSIVRDIILGGQDGLVNVLGIVLAVAEATQSKYVILVSGLAATFAESISMAAVAYTSAKAGKEFYARKNLELKDSVKNNPKEAKKIVGEVYSQCGLSGTLLNRAVSDFLRKPSYRILKQGEFEHPLRDAIIVGFSAIIGSFVPLISFMILPVNIAIWSTLAISTLSLLITGYFKGIFTGVKPLKSAFELAIIGMAAAVSGYLIGKLLGILPLG